MKRNKTKKTPRGRTAKSIIKKLKGNTVLLPGGGRYKVGESIRLSGQGITPIKRKGKVGKVGYSIDDVPDLKDWKPEVGEVGQGMPEVGFEVGGVGVEDNWKHYMYKPVGDWAPVAEPPSAWTSIRATLAGYARELWDAARWFFALPLRALPDVAAPAAPAPVREVPPLDSFQPAPAADVPPAEIPAPDPSRLYIISGDDLAKAHHALDKAKRKRKPRRRKD